MCESSGDPGPVKSMMMIPGVVAKLVERGSCMWKIVCSNAMSSQTNDLSNGYLSLSIIRIGQGLIDSVSR